MTRVKKIPELSPDAPAIRVMAMPRNSNAEGTIFGPFNGDQLWTVS